MSAAPVLEPPSDHTLAAAYRAGDEMAAAELVRRHAPALSRFLYSSGAFPDEIDDLVQEALFRAFRRLDSWRGEASFRSWLFVIGEQRAARRVPAAQGPADDLDRGSGSP